MTRERAKELAPVIAAYGEGKDIQLFSPANGWLDLYSVPEWPDGNVFRIKPEPKKRLMTREEVLGFIVHTPGIVTRYLGSASRENWSIPDWTIGHDEVERYRWATIDKQGNIGESHAFETEE